jgi:RHS repeat-associated protein
VAGAGYAPTSTRVMATLSKSGNVYTFTRRARETFTFDATTGKLTGLQDLNGYTTAVTYPTSTTLVVTDPGGNALTVTSNGSGQVTSVADGSSPARTATFSYDGSGNLVDAIDVGGGDTHFTYDSSHRMLTMCEPNAYAGCTSTPPASPFPGITNHYDASGRIDTQTDQLGRQTSFDYSTPNVTKVTDPKGNVVADTFTDGLLTSETKGYGTSSAATSRYYYDPNTLALITAVDPNGNTTRSYYDSSGNLLSQVDSLGRATTASYDTLDNPLTTTDGKGVTTTFAYDSHGNPTSRSTPLLASDGHTVLATSTNQWSYDSGHPGDLVSMTDPVGSVWTYQHDATFGWVTAEIAPATPENSSGNERTFSYDNHTGWLTSSVAPNGNLSGNTPSDFTTTYIRDAFGRLTATRDPLWVSASPSAHQTSSTYDADGNVISSTDGDGNQTTYVYNAADEPIETHRPDASGTVLYQHYWSDSSLKDQVDGAGATTSYAYDSLGRLTSVTTPPGVTNASGGTTTYTYDPGGRLTKKQDPGGTCPSTACTTYTYDAGNELKTVTYSDGVTPNITNVVYDADGQRTSMTEGTTNKQSTWAWDSLHRLTSTTDIANQTVSYAYNLRGQATSLTYPGSHAVTRTYDAAGRWASVQDWLSNTTTFGYDANSNLTAINYPTASVKDAFGFDDADEVTGVVTTSGSPATTLASFAYTRDGAGQLSSTSTTGLSVPSESYGYTALQQLSSVNTSGYGHDAADNLTGLPSGGNQGFDTANEVCWATGSAATGSCSSPPTGATTFSYDTRGNRVGSVPASGSSKSFGWDQASRLTSYGSGTTSASYTYNGDGLRMSKTVGGVVEPFVWDSSDDLPLMIQDGSTNFVYGPGGLPLEQVASSTVLWLHHDQLGSSRLLTDSGGATAGSATFDAYGDLTAASGTSSPLGYAGQYTDGESGLIYLRARSYDPASAQFLSRDPLVAVTGTAYAYASNDPLNGIDPTGMSFWSTMKEAATHPVKSLERGWDSMTTKQKVADVSLPIVAPAAAAACWFFCPVVAATGAALVQRTSSWIGEYCPWAGDETRAMRPASSPWGKVVQDFEADPSSWTQVSAHAEAATSRSYQGGVSLEEVFEKGQETLVRHTIYSGSGDILHQTFRPYAKFGG